MAFVVSCPVKALAKMGMIQACSTGLGVSMLLQTFDLHQDGSALPESMHQAVPSQQQLALCSTRCDNIT